MAFDDLRCTSSSPPHRFVSMQVVLADRVQRPALHAQQEHGLFSCRWFWATAFNDLRCTSSTIKAFFFAPVPAFTWFRILRMIALVFNLTNASVHLLSTGEEMSVHFVIFTVFALCWGLLGAELTLQWNAVAGVSRVDLSSLQQVLALAIGLRILLDGALLPTGDVVYVDVENVMFDARNPMLWIQYGSMRARLDRRAAELPRMPAGAAAGRPREAAAAARLRRGADAAAAAAGSRSSGLSLDRLLSAHPQGSSAARGGGGGGGGAGGGDSAATQPLGAALASAASTGTGPLAAAPRGRASSAGGYTNGAAGREGAGLEMQARLPLSLSLSLSPPLPLSTSVPISPSHSLSRALWRALVTARTPGGAGAAQQLGVCDHTLAL